MNEKLIVNAHKRDLEVVKATGEDYKKLIVNLRKPEGELGFKMLERMNESHEKLSQWGVSHLNIKNNYII